MAETAEDFSVHRFVSELFEDLSLTLPSLGCRFEGTVTASGLTVHGRQVFLKNKLFLLFADLASRVSKLGVQFRPSRHDNDLILGFVCHPFDGSVGLPSWDAALFQEFRSSEGSGFRLSLPAGPPMDAGPPVHWDQLAQLYGGAVNGRRMLDQVLIRCRTLLPELDSAIHDGDSPQILRIAHTLKGAARGVTAQALAEAALQIEMLGRAGDLSAAMPLFEKLLVSHNELVRFVKEGPAP
jgi:HPt (histidine-containing phosphotransfer) domain-containing protein